MTIVTDVMSAMPDADEDVTEAAEAFLKRFMPDAEPRNNAKEPSEKTEYKTQTTEPEVKEESEETPTDADETEETEEKKFASDDAYFKVKVGDEELEVSAKDLKRLYGQEAALTKRSQAVAESSKKAEAETTKAVTSLSLLLQRAQERAQPFRQINFLQAARELEPQHLENLRQQALQAFEEENFLKTELTGFVQNLQAKQEELLATKAQEAVTQLTDPASPSYLEGWGDQMYDELREFAVKSGLQQEIVDQLTDAPVFKLLHDAMLYQKGSKNVVTKKVDKTPKKIMKGSQSPSAPKGSEDKESKALARLRNTGHVDDAAELFMQRWSRNGSPD